jgi:MFS family permease
MSLIADYFPPARRATAVGTFLMGMVVGGGSALAVGGLLLQLANDGVFAGLPLVGTLAPWRQVLVLLGAPGVLMALLLLSLREPPRRERAAATGLSWRQTWQRLGEHRALLLPLYLAMALLSVGDFSLLNWSPALLSRRYGYAADELGLLLGGIAMATGVVATLGGGWLADQWGRVDGLRRRLCLACGLAVLALPGTLIGLAGGSSGLALAAFGLWSLLSSAAGCVAIAVLQQVLPNELRGFGTALAAFGNILLGLGLGSSLTAALTDHVFVDPAAVGWSISCVTLPAALAAALLLRHAVGVAAREQAHD